MMMKDDEVSRLRAAFTAPTSEAPDPGACPEPDRIWEAVRGELPPEEIREIVDHVALCASCAEDWRVAMEFEKEAQAEEERKATVYSFPARRHQPWIAAAAALVMTVTAIYVYQDRKPVIYRGGEPTIEALVPPGAALPRQSFVLAWKPVPGAESYDLLVSTGELDTVVSPKELTTTSHQVPVDALAGFPAATQLHWSVTAVFPDGRREQSETFRATLE